jgi:hypothetical protein
MTLTRSGAYDYIMEIITGAASRKVQTAEQKDAVNGIAALDAGGNVLAPGYRFTAARGAAEQITIRERTSAERVFRWIRIGVDDYEARVNVGGVEKVVQHEGMKDVASGIAGLDANVLLPPALLPLCMEEYSNHLGAVDNFTQTGTAGNGTANTDAANHEMDLSTGVTVTGKAYFASKRGFAAAARPIVVNMLIQNIVMGAGGNREVATGLAENWASFSGTHHAAFYSANTGAWVCTSFDGAGVENTSISPLSNGDMVSIVLSTSSVKFLVNAALVATHSTRIPTNAVQLGALVETKAMAATTARSISVDMMSVKRFL